jgi:hypothetical protein
VTLLPVIGLVQVGSQARAEPLHLSAPHRDLPRGGVAARRGERAARRSAGGAVSRRASVFCRSSASLSVVQLLHWKSSATLFRARARGDGGELRRAHGAGHRAGRKRALAGIVGALSRGSRHLPRLLPGSLQSGQEPRLGGTAPRSRPELEAAVQAQPAYTPARISLAYVLNRLGRPAEAAAHVRAGPRERPGSVLVLNNLAWIRATSLDDAVRDGAEAVRRARAAAVELDGGRNMRYIATSGGGLRRGGPLRRGRHDDRPRGRDRARLGHPRGRARIRRTARALRGREADARRAGRER